MYAMTTHFCGHVEVVRVLSDDGTVRHHLGFSQKNSDPVTVLLLTTAELAHLHRVITEHLETEYSHHALEGAVCAAEAVAAPQSSACPTAP